jgi:ElaB/YqjD/DUF883 family membrane-anchored ribosome-binding protein
MTTGIRDATSSAADQTGDVARTAVESVRESAGGAAETAKSRAREQLDRRSTQWGESVSGTAGDVRSISDELRKQGKEGPAKAADKAAEQAERIGAYLKEKDADALLHDVEDFGRQRPWAVAGIGLLVGIAAARLLKASSSARYAQRSSSAIGTSGIGAGIETRPAGLGGR